MCQNGAYSVPANLGWYNIFAVHIAYWPRYIRGCSKHAGLHICHPTTSVLADRHEYNHAPSVPANIYVAPLQACQRTAIQYTHAPSIPADIYITRYKHSSGQAWNITVLQACQLTYIPLQLTDECILPFKCPYLSPPYDPVLVETLWLFMVFSAPPTPLMNLSQ